MLDKFKGASNSHRLIFFSASKALILRKPLAMAHTAIAASVAAGGGLLATLNSIYGLCEYRALDFEALSLSLSRSSVEMRFRFIPAS